MNNPGMWMVKARGGAALVALALALAGLSCVTGCCNLAGMLESSAPDDESAEEEKKKKKPKKVKYKASYYGWVCSSHPSKKKSIYLPGKDADLDDDDDKAAKARRLVKELSQAANTPSASIPGVFSADSVGSSVAVAVELKKSRTGYKKGQRIILADPAKAGATADQDLAFVLAHALGHHKLGHSKTDSAAELAADHHAGYLLGLQGKSIADTTSWILAKAPAAERAERLKHTTEGWNKGCQESKKCGALTTPTPTQPDSSGPQKKYRSYGDREGI